MGYSAASVLASNHPPESVDWLIAAVVFVVFPAILVIWVIYGPEGRREKLRRQDPDQFYRAELARWAEKNPPPPPNERVAVDRECSECATYPLLGNEYPARRDWWRIPGSVSAEERKVILSDGPRAAWVICSKCGRTEPVLVSGGPWTINQKQLAEEAQRRAEADRRRDFAIQRDQERRRKNKLSTMKGLKSLTPSQFERAVGKILEVNGYQDIRVSGGPGDLAADIFCRDSEGRRVIVQCKKYVDKLVGSREMQSFIGMMTVEHRADAGLYVTTSAYTRPAAALARKHRVDLVDGDQLVELAQALHLAWDDEEIEELLRDPPKKETPPAPQWVREWRARERRRQARS